ncbi:putative ATP-dependent RNA helicase DHX57 isoform X2 [Bacillus rossius redtenbacheri]|uniref:putative ATP-dependent RNA helicase DHX57 isoform X2 n=1 Tax=Bacillus rossius redtenbacheri TaxID=93214 RepID=UPI002FDE74BC
MNSIYDDEEYVLKTKKDVVKGSRPEGRGRPERPPPDRPPPSNLKVEMHTISLSKESQEAMLQTLRLIHGPEFRLKDQSSYKDKGKNLGSQYWVDRGHLVVSGGVDYSNKRGSQMSDSELQHSFALDRLASYGFQRQHCAQALKATGEDVGAALEVLGCRYFGLDLPFLAAYRPGGGAGPPPPPTEEEQAQREDEKGALEAIYDAAFKETIAGRVWELGLRLDHLLELFSEKTGGPEDPAPAPALQKKPGAQVCRFYLKGKCKFTYNCKYSHDVPVTKADAAEEKNYNFQLEIRFPEGSRYPQEPALLFLKTKAPLFPAEALLQLTNWLMLEARACAEDNSACVYTIAQMLQDNVEEAVRIVLGPYKTFLPFTEPLFGSGGAQDPLVEENTLKPELNGERTKRLPRSSVPLERLQREDGALASKFLKKKSLPKYVRFMGVRQQLPAFAKLQEVLAAVRQHQVVVVCGETGCGKSTQIPQYLLDDWLVRYQSTQSHVEIVCTQPRRLSAIGVAERVADERAERIGDTVGYQIRLESKMSSATRLLFCTTGILLRRLESDPGLANVSHVIVDEVHERSEESDILLLILKDLLEVRKDLRVILMSATVNAELFSQYFSSAPTLNIPGRTYPVEQVFLEDVLEQLDYVLEEGTAYARPVKAAKRDGAAASLEVELATADLSSARSLSSPRLPDEDLTLLQLCARYQEYSKQTVKNLYLMDMSKINNDLIESILVWILEGTHQYPKDGCILVFLPGIAEIMSLHDQLLCHPAMSPQAGTVVLVPLHSTLGHEEQAAVFRKPKPGVRKIVLSTNIAETSITIDDCVFVIDSGRMKEKRFDANKNMESLEMAWESRANAKQRRGRAGRVKPGVCVCLFTRHRLEHVLAAQPVPELHRVPLDQLLLRIKTLPRFAADDVHQVLGKTIEPPPESAVDSALARLKNVGALNIDKELTPLGRHLAALPVDVRIGKLMLFGAIFSCIDSALTIAACLNYKSPFVSPFGKRDAADASKREFATGNSDHLTMLKAYKTWLGVHKKGRSAGHRFAQENYLSDRTLLTLADIKHQFLELLASIGFVSLAPARRRAGEDSVLEMTGPQMNAHSGNQRLLAATLCAALYPNVVKVLTPEKSYAPSVMGAIPMEVKPEQIRFKTKDDGFVFLHPSSVNCAVSRFASPYLVYQEKMKTSRVFIRDSTMVPMLPFVLFSGCGVCVELHRGDTVLSLDDGWVVFAVHSHQVAELLSLIRQELVKLLEEKIENPELNLLADSKLQKVIATIIKLVTSQ